MIWHQMYETAQAHLDAAAGYYNNNVCVESERGRVNVRIPIPGASTMDLRIWHEHEVLRALRPHVTSAPQLLHASDDPPYQVHEFIHGTVLNDVAPRRTAVPTHVISDVVELLVRLSQIPRDRLPEVPPHWPDEDDTIAFAHRLSDLTQSVYDMHVDDYGDLYHALGIPSDPVGPAVHMWSSLSPRPLVCVHADLHRKNMIVQGSSTVFLDWELALFGDPVYEIAVHLHKMEYLHSEQIAVSRLWSSRLPRAHTEGWEHDVETYLAHERIKSAIVDSVRYAQVFSGTAKAPEPRSHLVDKLTAKLNNAYLHWGRTDPIERARVAEALVGFFPPSQSVAPGALMTASEASLGGVESA